MKRVSKQRRRLIHLLDGWACVYCGDSVDRRSATLDHVVPRSEGGGNEPQNLVTCCEPCNLKWGSRTEGKDEPVRRALGRRIARAMSLTGHDKRRIRDMFGAP